MTQNAELLVNDLNDENWPIACAYLLLSAAQSLLWNTQGPAGLDPEDKELTEQLSVTCGKLLYRLEKGHF